MYFYEDKKYYDMIYMYFNNDIYHIFIMYETK